MQNLELDVKQSRGGRIPSQGSLYGICCREFSLEYGLWLYEHTLTLLLLSGSIAVVEQKDAVTL